MVGLKVGVLVGATVGRGVGFLVGLYKKYSLVSTIKALHVAIAYALVGGGAAPAWFNKPRMRATNKTFKMEAIFKNLFFR